MIVQEQQNIRVLVYTDARQIQAQKKHALELAKAYKTGPKYYCMDCDCEYYCEQPCSLHVSA
jgi:hypothetical protein